MNADPTMITISVEDMRRLLTIAWVLGYSNHGHNHGLYLENEKREAFIDRSVLDLTRAGKAHKAR